MTREFGDEKPAEFAVTSSLLNKYQIRKGMLSCPRFWLDVQKIAALCTGVDSLGSEDGSTGESVKLSSPSCLLLLNENNESYTRAGTTSIINTACILVKANHVLWDEVNKMVIERNTTATNLTTEYVVQHLVVNKLGDLLVANYHSQQRAIQKRAEYMAKEKLPKVPAPPVDAPPDDETIDSPGSPGRNSRATTRQNTGLESGPLSRQASMSRQASKNSAASHSPSRQTSKRGITDESPLLAATEDLIPEDTLDCPEDELGSLSDEEEEEEECPSEEEIARVTVWNIPLNINGMLLANGASGVKGELKVVILLQAILRAIQCLMLGSFPAATQLVAEAPAIDKYRVGKEFGDFMGKQKFVFTISSGNYDGSKRDDLAEVAEEEMKVCVPTALSSATGITMSLLNFRSLCPCLLPFLHYLYIHPSKYCLSDSLAFDKTAFQLLALRTKVSKIVKDVVISSFHFLDGPHNFICKHEDPLHNVLSAGAVAAVRSVVLSRFVNSAIFAHGAGNIISQVFSFVEDFFRGNRSFSKFSFDANSEESRAIQIVYFIISTRFTALLPVESAQRFFTLYMCRRHKTWESFGEAVTSVTGDDNSCSPKDSPSLNAEESIPEPDNMSMLWELLSVSETIVEEACVAKEQELAELSEDDVQLFDCSLDEAVAPRKLNGEVGVYHGRKEVMARYSAVFFLTELPFREHHVVKEICHLSKLYGHVVDSPSNMLSQLFMRIASNIYLHGCVRIYDTAGGFIAQQICDIYKNYVAAGKPLSSNTDILYCKKLRGELNDKQMFEVATCSHSYWDPLTSKTACSSCIPDTMDDCFLIYVGSTESKGNIVNNDPQCGVIAVTTESRDMISGVMLLYMLLVLLREEHQKQHKKISSSSQYSKIVQYWLTSRSLYYSNLKTPNTDANTAKFKEACSQLNYVLFETSDPSSIACLVKHRVKRLCTLMTSVSDIMGYEFSVLMWKQFESTMNLLLPLELFYPNSANESRGHIAPLSDGNLSTLQPLALHDTLQVSLMLVLNTIQSVVSKDEYMSILLRLLMKYDTVDNNTSREFMDLMMVLLHDSLNTAVHDAGRDLFKAFNSSISDTDINTEQFYGDGEQYMKLQLAQVTTETTVNGLSNPRDVSTGPTLSQPGLLLLKKIWKLCLLYRHTIVTGNTHEHDSIPTNGKHCHVESVVDGIVQENLEKLLLNGFKY